MDIMLYKFPLGDEYDRLESVHCKMTQRIRNGDKLSNEELDWYDWAERYLLTADKYIEPEED